MQFKLYRNHFCGDEFCDECVYIDTYDSLEAAQQAAQAKIDPEPLVWVQGCYWNAVVDRYDSFVIIQIGATQ